MGERTEINNLQIKLNIPMRMVTGCINTYDLPVTLTLLKLAEKKFNAEKDAEKNSGINITRKFTSAGTIFKHCITNEAAKAKTAAHANALSEQIKEWGRIRDRQHEEGFRPTAEKLREMIEKLYDNGEISIHEYELGCKGTDLIGGIVTDKQEE